MAAARFLSFQIPLEPMALRRPRVSFATRSVYSDQAHDKLAMGLYMKQALGEQKPFEGPLRVTAYFYFKRPRGKKYADLVYFERVPDCDNLFKMIADVGQECGLWHNDSIICSIIAEKFYTDQEPRTYIEIKELKK